MKATTRLLGLLAALLALAITTASAEDKKDEPCDKSKCPWNLWDHYRAKGCEPVYANGSCCPTSYNCDEYNKVNSEEGCQFKGHLYRQGENINTSNPCHTCRCGAMGVSGCAVIECFNEMSQPRCIPLFDHKECCPNNYYCLHKDRKSIEEVTDVHTCKYKDRSYVEGQIVEIDDNPCVTCICKPGFTGANSTSCKKVECPFPGNNLKMKRGCCPVYMAKRCCSVDWICPPPEESKSLTQVPPDACVFGNRIIPQGEELDLQNPCTKCKCQTPPDLTCIREECAGPPNGNFQACHPVPKEGQCCPEFRCFRPDEQMGPPHPGQGLPPPPPIPQ